MPGGIIYLITCRPTGKNYVGQTVGPLWRRWKQHYQAHRGWANPALWAAIQKYGREAFDRTVLERVERLEDLNPREVHWAGVYNSLAPNGYNLKVGNGHSVVVSGETRAKIAAASRRDWATHEGRAKRLAALEASLTPERASRLAESMRRAWAREGTESPRVIAIRRALNAPEVRARRSAQQTPEVRAKTSRLMRERWSDPTYRGRMMPVLRRRVAEARARRDPGTGRWSG